MTSNTSKCGQNSWQVFLMTARTECVNSRYLGSVLSWEDIANERDWNMSLISTTLVTPVSLSHLIPRLHTSQLGVKWECKDVACTAGNANSEGSLRRRTWRQRVVKNWFVHFTIIDQRKLLLGTVASLGLSTLTRAGKKKRGTRSEWDETFGAIFVSTWDRCTDWHSSKWIINWDIISMLYSGNFTWITALGTIPELLATQIYSFRDGWANKVPLTFFRMLPLCRTTQLFCGSLHGIKRIKPFSDKFSRSEMMLELSGSMSSSPWVLRCTMRSERDMASISGSGKFCFKKASSMWHNMEIGGDILKTSLLILCSRSLNWFISPLYIFVRFNARTLTNIWWLIAILIDCRWLIFSFSCSGVVSRSACVPTTMTDDCWGHLWHTPSIIGDQ